MISMATHSGFEDRGVPTKVLICHDQLLLILGYLTLSLPNATVVEFTVHCQTRLQSKFKGTVDSCLFLTVIRNTTICSLFQNVQGT